MSLVGTRPPTVDEWDKYELHHRARLATKPGLTGMWQVSGRSNITDLNNLFSSILQVLNLAELGIGAALICSMYESFEGYELPPRTQFSMLKKPEVSIKYGQLTFNMAAIRLFEGVKHVLTVVKEAGCCTLCRGRKCICRMSQSQQTGQMGE